MKSTEYAHTSIIGHIHSQTIFASYVVFLPIVEHAFHWSISIITNHLPLFSVCPSGFWSTRFLYHYRPDPSLCWRYTPTTFVRFSWFHTELLCFYICIITLYIYIYIYRYVYIYTDPILNSSHANFPRWTCFAMYIYKYQFVLCPFSFEYLHLLIPTLLGSSALQLEGGSKQTAEKRQEAYFQDRWVVEKMETTCFSKNLTLGQN